ncbi:MAG: ArsC family transcriptional regulator [Ruminococcaceae bacterium]|nr:ArsC family transcriptional regulator [Oscillospiraceae bacterium]
MNIQIFGKSKCFDTKKAERYFKERRIKYQMVDLLRYGLSGKEFDAVLLGIGGVDNLIDWNGKSPEITLMKYMEDVRAKEDKLFDDPSLMRTPIVRNGRQVTVGYCPEIWEKWD